MNPKFNRFILIENICLVLIMLVLVVIPAINKNTSTHSDVVVKEQDFAESKAAASSYTGGYQQQGGYQSAPEPQAAPAPTTTTS